jgi:hypothetical protein
MEFIAASLEAAGFIVATDDWPVIAVHVGDRRHTVMVGSGGPKVRRLRRAVVQLQRLVEDL